MSAYLIASYDIEDAQAHDDYASAADFLLTKHGGKLLVADDRGYVLEGKGSMINVIVQFESEIAAMDFYNDPEYNLVKQIRLNATQNGSLVLVKDLNGLSV
ncbi:DUF1330 domain-containing protein [Teredinibacter sp. KSP-S5-2]|uniref:DUF1330 domain-containing protein n=1 Tax=Teredinibacter sp. KSP-S5-2 TaxID=3034506 RepID=UPI0029344D82|nr:DUF1330 domain-containing protein [Teredinibacter sp. KSP-S5-2]WNO08551.1 DUF1330 domain-containing protein [Teredinibacter sp. KSP-S5-2]